MKELSIEQKAKAYDEALERTKQIIMDYDYDENDNVFMEIFPELKENKESEDERISKEIIKYLERTVPHHHRDEVLKSKEWIAWLERQATPQMVEDAFLKGCNDTKKSLLKKQGEKKPAEWSEKDEGNLNDAILFIETGTYSLDKDNLINWLKSLKERYAWKPSELPHWKKSSLPNDKTTGFNSDNFCYKGYYINYKELFDKLPKDD